MQIGENSALNLCWLCPSCGPGADCAGTNFARHGNCLGCDVAPAEGTQSRDPKTENVPYAIAADRRFPAAGLAQRTCPPRLAASLATACLCISISAAADDSLVQRAHALEPAIQGFPQHSLVELDKLLAQAATAPAAERWYIAGLQAQASVLAGRSTEAVAMAEKLQADAIRTGDKRAMATALLIGSVAESSHGEAVNSLALARQAHDQLKDSDFAYLKYWAALAQGQAARLRGQSEESLASLQEALSLAEAADDPFRRSTVLYQLSVLQLILKNDPEALAASLAAFKYGQEARSIYAMANARMAESAVREDMGQPARELAAMEEAVAIAHGAHSDAAEAKALVNFADIRLHRKQYAEALNLAQRALALANTLGDTGVANTSKANIGFALFGLGRIPEGKRYTDAALAGYERAGATSDTIDLVTEYGDNLERLGDYRGAIELYHREHALTQEVMGQTRQRALMEVQEKYESEKRSREIDLLNRENDLKTKEIATRELQQRVWWSLAALFALSFAVVVVLYRKLRVTNALLAAKNAELSVQSSHDALTGLYNRRFFHDFITAENSPAERRRRGADSKVHALLLIDIDHFKETNDRFGHALGDAVLVAVADRLRETLRETDMIVRWGGEEFLVFATTSVDRIDEIAARILRAISAEPITLHDKVIRTTVSIGYVPMPLPPSDVALSWDRAIGLIDMALYMAKVKGRNRAYGIRRLASGDAETLAAAERDLEHAVNAGLVEMDILFGPTPDSAPSAATHSA
jgi:diguanylate cyclase (GGDEF)-like protein